MNRRRTKRKHPKARVSVIFRPGPEIVGVLWKMAVAELRSVDSLVTMLVREAIEAREAKKGKP